MDNNAASSKDQNDQFRKVLDEVKEQRDRFRKELDEVKQQIDRMRKELDEVKEELKGRPGAPEKQSSVSREVLPKEQTDQSQVSAGRTDKKIKKKDRIYIRNVSKDKVVESFIQKFSLFGKKRFSCIEKTDGANEMYPIVFVCKCTTGRYIDDLGNVFEKVIEENVQGRAAIVYIHMEDKKRGTTENGLFALWEKYPSCQATKIYHITFRNNKIPKSMFPFRKNDNERAMSDIQEFVQKWYKEKM